MIKKTFEEVLKAKLQKDINALLADGYKIRVTGDVSEYLANKKIIANKTILCVIRSGNATRISSDSILSYTQPASLMLYVPINYKDDFSRVMKNYTDEQSKQSYVQKLDEYYASFNYSTVAFDGVKFQNGDVTFLTGILMGTILYTDHEFTLGDDISFAFEDLSGETKINNVFSVQTSRSANVENFTPVGKKYQTLNIVTETLDYQLQILYNSNDKIHQTLRDASNDFIDFSLRQTIEVSKPKVEYSKLGKFMIGIQFNDSKDNFSTITLQLLATN